MRLFPGSNAMRGLVGRSALTLPPDDWELIADEGTLGLVADFHRAEGRELPPKVLEAFLQCIAFQMRCASFLAELSERLPKVTMLVFKGCGLAYTLYPRPGQRNFGDIDLAVQLPDWPAVTFELERLGFLAGLERGEYYRGGLRVDLHAHPLGQLLPLFRTEALSWWDRSEILSDRTGGIRRLCYEHEFVLCLLHSAKHSFSRCHWFGDLLLLAQKLGAKQAFQVVRDYRVERSLAYAEYCLQHLFGLRMFPEYIFPKFNGLERRFLSRVVERRAPAFLGMLTPLSAAKDSRQALRFLVSVLFPANKGFWQRTRQLWSMARIAFQD